MNFVGHIKKMKVDGKGLMPEEQYMAIGRYLDKLSPCNFLIFGLGEDAQVWQQINKGGRTVFLEDDAEWISRFDDKNLEIYQVEYNTKAKDHESIGFDPQKLDMQLPKEVTETTWDIILVDGPLGHNPPRPYKGPGRMKSIYHAHKLLKEGGVCAIDDMIRKIERKYAHHFFGENNICKTEGKVVIFKKYTT